MAPTPRPTVATPSLNKSSGASLAIDSSDDESDPWRAQQVASAGQQDDACAEKEEGDLQEEGELQEEPQQQPGEAPPSSALLLSVRQRSIASIAGSCASPSVRGDYDYAHSQEIGRGAYGVVVTARHRPTGETRALKVIDKGALEPKQWEALEAEVAILASLEHPNIVRLHEHFDDGAGHHVLAMEYLKGGELLDRLLAKQARGGMEHAAYTEASCRAVIAQVLGAVAHCHARGIVHRDLKPENMVLTSPDDDESFKIVDFGNAKAFAGSGGGGGGRGAEGGGGGGGGAGAGGARKEDEALLNTYVYSPLYVAPELLEAYLPRCARTGYGSSVDVWAIGVIAFVLLSGAPPFFGDADAPNEREHKRSLFRRVLRGEFAFAPASRWAAVSPLAKGFIRRVLVLDPADRDGAAALLEDPWITSASVPEVPLEEAVAALKALQARRRWRAAASVVRTVNRMQRTWGGSGGGGGGGGKPAGAAAT